MTKQISRTEILRQIIEIQDSITERMEYLTGREDMKIPALSEKTRLRDIHIKLDNIRDKI